MRVLIHDYAGHPFQVSLSRELARRGHSVCHAWFAGDSGPKGTLQRQSRDPDGLTFHALGTEIAYSKTDFVKRRHGDRRYGAELAQFTEAYQPDVVLSGNTPTEAQSDLVQICQRLQVAFVYWCQDFYSLAVSRLLAKKLPILGALVGSYYRSLDRQHMLDAARIVTITDGFLPQMEQWGISRSKVDVIPNWGALDDVPVLPRTNAWTRKAGLEAGYRFVYSGTLAMKHNPGHLIALAQALPHAGHPQDQVVAVTAGVGASQLAQAAKQVQNRLKVLPLQPFDRLAEVLAAGDVLLAVIERDAGEFSVPSKILNYLCAGRPIVLAAPSQNLAAQILQQTGAGTVVDPDDTQAFVDAAQSYRDHARAQKAGNAGRAYAQEHFALDRVGDRFERTLYAALVGVRDRVAS